jgi:non-homologous end joining protein Ku
VVVEESELDQMVPRSSRVMQVLEFVPAAEVDPVYLDPSYYVVPERAGEKPYTLLYRMFTFEVGVARRRRAPCLTRLALLGEFFPRDYTGVCVG